MFSSSMICTNNQLKIKQLNSEVICSITVVQVFFPLYIYIYKCLYLRVKISNRQLTSTFFGFDPACCTKQIMGIVSKSIRYDKKTICHYKILRAPCFLQLSWNNFCSIIATQDDLYLLI